MVRETNLDIQALEADEEMISFQDIFDPEMLKKIHANYDRYMEENDFKKNIMDEIFVGVSANDHLNYLKIAKNLGFTKEGLDQIPDFLLSNCVAFHTTDLHINSPEKVTYNHKIALYSFDMYNDMLGDDDYPHETYVEQLNEIYEMMSDNKSESFINSAYKMLIDSYVSTYKEFLEMQEAKKKKK